MNAFEDLVNNNFKFYKKVKDDKEMSQQFFSNLFGWYVDGRIKPSTVKKK